MRCSKINTHSAISHTAPSRGQGPDQTDGQVDGQAADQLTDLADDQVADQAMVESGARGKALRVRRDIVSGQIMEEADLIRFVLAPDGTIVPDLNAKLPGRGIWVAAKREAVNIASAKGLFSRGAKAKASAGPDLADQIEQLLRAKLLELLGLALRSGQLETGFDKVRAMITAQPPAWRVAASEAARDGRNKIRMASKAAWNATPLIGCFNAAELGAALGRDDVTHAAMHEGQLAQRFEREALRLKGFTDLLPAGWTTESEDFELWRGNIVKDSNEIEHY